MQYWSEYDQKKILKAFKKEFACNGTIVDDEDLGQVIQLQGDQRQKISAFLIEEGINKQDVKVHGFWCSSEEDVSSGTNTCLIMTHSPYQSPDQHSFLLMPSLCPLCEHKDLIRTVSKKSTLLDGQQLQWARRKRKDVASISSR